MNEYTVGEVGRLTHVSVRTLHHYHAIDLLAPGGRSAAGYRLYSDADLQRLQQILYYRELGFGLDEIASILADPEATAGDHLRRQHRVLREQIARNEALVAAIEKQLEAHQMGIPLTPDEQFEVFGGEAAKLFGGEYSREAEQRWGDAEPWAQSQRRTAAYTQQDWLTMKAAADANVTAFAELARSGEPATDRAATGLAEQHRQHISRWCYDCNYAIHCGLAEMYIADPRFRATYDTAFPGLAQYVHDAILANSDHAAGG